MTKRRWRKSTHSGSPEGECVEVEMAVDLSIDQSVAVRDTKARKAGQITMDGEAWRALLAAVRD